jgi:hypothetical protein
MRLLTSSFVVVLGLVCPFFATVAIAGDDSAVSAPDVRTADEIVRLVTETYKNCSTYRDSGVVTTLFIGTDGHNHTEKQRFTTAFVRPDRFRFEYRHRFFEDRQKPGAASKPDRYIIWRQGKDVRTWWDLRPGEATKSSLDLALGGAFAVSGRSSEEITALLLPQEICCDRLTHIHDTNRLADAELGEANCIRIQGKDGDGDLTTFWIDSKNLLIRRIDSGHDFGDFRTEETMTYDDPVTNGQIPEEKLAFDPPTEDAGEANLR